MIALSLESLLEDLGCVVADIASTPQAALATIGNSEFDAAILDVNLNGQDSFGVAAALTERRVPFLFATGYGSSRMPPEFAHHPVVQKPYRFEELTAALHTIFSTAVTQK